ncbi:MAG: hypothetical protein HQ557_11195 [Bacteroidetes bacterium]|nr:hypothetical protein [Bacteroidota bacterium]
MIFSDATFEYFVAIQHKIRSAMAESKFSVPYYYEDEPFFCSYETLFRIWVKKISRRKEARSLNISRDTLRDWETRFVQFGARGLLPEVSHKTVDPLLERLVVLIKDSRPHESASLTLKMAVALKLRGAHLELIRQIQRSHGYGQRLNTTDVYFFRGLQHIMKSRQLHRTNETPVHDNKELVNSFFNFDKDSFQQRIELFKKLSGCQENRQIRPILKQFGIHPNRFYELKKRYLHYGVWGLVDLVQITKRGEKISPELELQIIEERLMAPDLRPEGMIEKLDLKCGVANVRKIYSRWKLSELKEPVLLRGGVIAKQGSVEATVPPSSEVK